MLTNRTLFIFHTGQTYPSIQKCASRWKQSVPSRLLFKVAGYLEYRRKPRHREYMVKLAKDVFHDFHSSKILEIEDDLLLPVLNWTEFDQIVLLWPDANGTGWGQLERQVFRQKDPQAGVIVLNGRRRCFMMNGVEWYEFKFRRFVEKSFIVETCIFITFMVMSPWLALWDLLRGRS